MKTILDPCCGGRMFWFNRSHPDAVFGDARSESIVVTDRSHDQDGTRTLNIAPDILMDFRDLPYPDGSFALAKQPTTHQVHDLCSKFAQMVADDWRDKVSVGLSAAGINVIREPRVK
jgi:hypothetical protein